MIFKYEYSLVCSSFYEWRVFLIVLKTSLFLVLESNIPGGLESTPRNPLVYRQKPCIDLTTYFHVPLSQCI